MFEKMLPIGSVVLLKNAMKKVMITGFKQVSTKNQNEIKDYLGVVYPMGNIGNGAQLLFNDEDICDVIFKGYVNSEWEEMINALEKEYNNNSKFAAAIKNKSVITSSDA